MPRKPFYKTPEEMQKAIDNYFLLCQGKPFLDENGDVLRDKYGEIILQDAKPPTVTGLALALGFTSRQALLNYQAKRAFVDTVTRAKSRVEEYTEERLFDREGQRGAEFSLTHNFKWIDKKDEEETKSGGVVLLAPVLPEPVPPGDEGVPET